GAADPWLRRGPQIRDFGGGRRPTGGWCTPRAHIHVRTRGRGTSPRPDDGHRCIDAATSAATATASRTAHPITAVCAAFVRVGGGLAGDRGVRDPRACVT